MTLTPEQQDAAAERERTRRHCQPAFVALYQVYKFARDGEDVLQLIRAVSPQLLKELRELSEAGWKPMAGSKDGPRT